ncbi:hypothetical protein DXA06_18930, partial [Bacteroides ovatus]
FKVTKKQTYLQLLIGLRKKKTVEIKKRLPPNLTKNQKSFAGELEFNERLFFRKEQKRKR